MTGWRSIWIAALIGVLLFALKTTVIDNAQTSIKTERFAQGIAAGARTPLEAVFRNGITLLGVTVPQTAQSGAEARLQAFWTVQEPIVDNYSALYRLVNANGQRISETRRYEPGFIATENWQPDLYVEDTPTLDIPPYTPPGTYTLEVALYDAETGAFVDALNAAGNPIGVYLPLTTLDITRPASQPEPQVPPVADVPDTPLTLVEIADVPEAAQVGDALTMTWVWQTTQALTETYRARLVWQDVLTEEIIASTQATPLTLYPTEQWQAGDTWRGLPRLYVPGTLSAGEYIVSVQVSAGDIADDAPVIALSRMDVTTPDRDYTLPDSAIIDATAWQNDIKLAGFNTFKTDSVTEITLYWTTTAPIRESLRYYVHVLPADETDERIIAQDDAIPVAWTRPTTSWDTDEIITTTHTFTELDSGAYRVRVGWYDPLTGERVTLRNGTDDGHTLPMPLRIRDQKIPKMPKNTQNE